MRACMRACACVCVFGRRRRTLELVWREGGHVHTQQRLQVEGLLHVPVVMLSCCMSHVVMSHVVMLHVVLPPRSSARSMYPKASLLDSAQTGHAAPPAAHEGTKRYTAARGLRLHLPADAATVWLRCRRTRRPLRDTTRTWYRATVHLRVVFQPLHSRPQACYSRSTHRLRRSTLGCCASFQA